jgi:uncharacterized protein (TIGR00251 family)
MEWMNETAGGIQLTVQAVPRAAKNEILGVHGGALKIRLTAPPVDGKANDALIRFLADALEVPRANIEIRVGQTGRKKVVRVSGLTAEEIEAKLL